jgi:hypothetical protein
MESQLEHELLNSSEPSMPEGGVRGVAGVAGVDAATLVSVGSSCVILVSGCIAVACLVAYMRNMKNESRVQTHCRHTCAKCDRMDRERQTQMKPPFAPLPRTPTTAHTTRELMFTEKSFCGVVSELKCREDDDNVSERHNKGSSPPPDYRRVVVIRDDSCDLLYKTHSQSAITSCSSNHEELVGAYEFGRKQQLLQQTVSAELERKVENSSSSSSNSSPLTLTPDDNSTDSGIRQFTARAANPFEVRESSSAVESSRRRTSHIEDDPFGAITRHRSRRPSWSLTTTIKSSTRLTDRASAARDGSSSPPLGLSSDEDVVSDDYEERESSEQNSIVEDTSQYIDNSESAYTKETLTF